MNNKKGFTLIELLAVIVILAIIALITIPLIMNIISDAKKGAFLNSSYGIIKAAEQGYAKSLIKETEIEETEYIFNNGNQTLKNGNVTFNFKGSSPEYGNIIITDEGKVSINFYSGGLCATKGYESDEVIIRETERNEDCVPDLIPPSLTLIGEAEISIKQNATNYQEPGYSAIDNIDGNITEKVQISNNIQFGVPGEYEIIYVTTDLAGNKSIKTRKIIIEEEPYAVDIFVGYNGAMILMNDGTLKQINSASANTSTSFSALSGVKQVSVGTYHTVFLMNNGTVKAMGQNNYGQLGDGTITNRSTPVTVVGLSNVKQVSAGDYHTLFLMNDGTVKVTGSHGYGQLGTGQAINSSTYKTTPTTISLSNVKQISAGNLHSVFLMSDGTVKATGYNNSGGLGIGNNTPKPSPTNVATISGVVQIEAGQWTTFYIMNNNMVKATGDVNYGRLGIGNIYDSQLTPISILNGSDIKQISSTTTHTLFLMNNGRVRATGNNYNGQLGDGAGATNAVKWTSILIPNLIGVTKVGTGNGFSMFLMEDGTVRKVGLGTNNKIIDIPLK